MSDDHISDNVPLLYIEKKQIYNDFNIKFNLKNTKKIALCCVFWFIVIHSCIHLFYSRDSCKWLLSDGRYKGDMGWQPYGCMMHKYSELDCSRCLQYLAFRGYKNQFVFIGDSRMLEMYNAFIHTIEPNAQLVPNPKSLYALESDYNFHDSRLKLDVSFIWSPYVIDSMIKLKSINNDPRVIVAGGAIWSIINSNGSINSVKDYAANLTQLINPFNEISSKSTILWVLQEPVEESKLDNSLKIVTNKLIDLYNEVAMDVLSQSIAEMWWSSRLVSQGGINDSPDGLHSSNESLRLRAQILLNFYCNDHMNFNDGTCCSSTEPLTTLQAYVFLAFIVCMFIGILMEIRYCRYRLSKNDVSYVLMTSLSKLGIIMMYFYLCDRTNFFMKENKYYSDASFWLPVGYVFVLGLFFTEESRYTKLLHRDQTDEWKGWMQLVILIYHLTGANIKISISNHVQTLIAAYLFLTGFGHFCYIWHKNDVGLTRYFQVLFRLNMLTIVLCICMNRPYQFYFYIPLVSFWFTILYLLLLCPPRVTAASSETRPTQYLYIIFKILVLLIFIIILYMSEVFFDKIFLMRPWKALFVTTDDDIHEWWIRWQLNRFSIMYGIIISFIIILIQRYNFIDDNNHSNLVSPRLAVFSSILALIGLTASTAYNILCQNQTECSEFLSYTSIIPILSYIIIRNMSGILRTKFSSLFAWFGRISLELMVCQCHIWLAADTHGVLVLLPGYPVLNGLIVSFIFICICHELHEITTKLTPLAVPTEHKDLFRNLICFILLLIPLGASDGMF
ncbi:N-acetylneuraminate 9-O-acetyltransferase isoform X1 [Daktulosphaira vitifoliae]|uniref:N-acetylneuraminate 9-O-acetyltransferase isoform X1 n=1 Tax=Daktulosphaira vitifoliae TaxID=58002 RepID=UPI0021AA4903|nr:N-acetylneuraminate 9-O-acetyltransferase isoform X1 [Daktulosphaira vitifoliae]